MNTLLSLWKPSLDEFQCIINAIQLTTNPHSSSNYQVCIGQEILAKMVIILTQISAILLTMTETTRPSWILPIRSDGNAMVDVEGGSLVGKVEGVVESKQPAILNSSDLVASIQSLANIFGLHTELSLDEHLCGLSNLCGVGNDQQTPKSQTTFLSDSIPPQISHTSHSIQYQIINTMIKCSNILAVIDELYVLMVCGHNIHSTVGVMLSQPPLKFFSTNCRTSYSSSQPTFGMGNDQNIQGSMTLEGSTFFTSTTSQIIPPTSMSQGTLQPSSDVSLENQYDTRMRDPSDGGSMENNSEKNNGMNHSASITHNTPKTTQHLLFLLIQFGYALLNNLVMQNVEVVLFQQWEVSEGQLEQSNVPRQPLDQISNQQIPLKDTPNIAATATIEAQTKPTLHNNNKTKTNKGAAKLAKWIRLTKLHSTQLQPFRKLLRIQ